MSVNKDILIKELASKVSKSSLDESIKIASTTSTSGRALTSMEKLDAVVSNYEVEKIASEDPQRFAAIVKLAAQAQEEMRNLQQAELVANMTTTKIAQTLEELIEKRAMEIAEAFLEKIASEEDVEETEDLEEENESLDEILKS